LCLHFEQDSVKFKINTLKNCSLREWRTPQQQAGKKDCERAKFKITWM
jgi:hypothetical protein